MGKNKPGYHHAYREDLRQKAFLTMGNQCQNCGENDPMVLCIDHIEPIGHVRRLTTQIYFEIIQNPEAAKQKYQLLCRNCNWRKMIINNERAAGERQFALKQEHDALMERVTLLEHKIIIRQTRIEKEESECASEQILEQPLEQPVEEIIEQKLMPEIPQLLNDRSGKLDVNKMRVFLRNQGIRLSHWKAYQIKGNIEVEHPQLFEQP